MNQRAPALITAKASNAAMCVSSGAGGRDQSQRHTLNATTKPSNGPTSCSTSSVLLWAAGNVLAIVLAVLPSALCVALVLVGWRAWRHAQMESAIFLLVLATAVTSMATSSRISNQFMAQFYRGLRRWASLRSLSRAGGGPAPKTRRLPAAAPASPRPQTQTPKESA